MSTQTNLEQMQAYAQVAARRDFNTGFESQTQDKFAKAQANAANPITVKITGEVNEVSEGNLTFTPTTGDAIIAALDENGRFDVNLKKGEKYAITLEGYLIEPAEITAENADEIQITAIHNE